MGQKQEIIVVSFGTTDKESRRLDIESLETAIQKAYPEWIVKGAVLSEVVSKLIKIRDGENKDDVPKALQRAKDKKINDVVLLPALIMEGTEYDRIQAHIEKYERYFLSVNLAKPLFVVSKNKEKNRLEHQKIIKVLLMDTLNEAEIESIEDARNQKTAIVYIGHGSIYKSNKEYEVLQDEIDKMGYQNVFAGVIKGIEGSELLCKGIFEKVKAGGYQKVIFRPFMVSSGWHAKRDIMDDKNPLSFVNQFKEMGFEGDIICMPKGLGRLEAVQEIYIDHVLDVLNKMNM